MEKQRWKRENIISLATRHGILPLVYKTLRHLDTESKPDLAGSESSLNILQPSNRATQYINAPLTDNGLLSELKAHYINISQKNIFMTAELLRIMKLFEKNGIHALAFKGPALAHMAYGDITLRQFGDLDIYVQKSDIARIARILEKDKYDARVDLKFFNNDAFLNVNSDVQFYRESGNILIEIHWTVFRNTFSSTMKNIDLWDKPSIVHIQNKTLYTFKTETLLLYLCMHGSKHTWERIEWITDIDRLIRAADTLDWDEVYRLARIADGVTMLELGLLLSSELFNTPLSENIVNNLTSNKKCSQLVNDVLSLLNQKNDILNTELKKNYRHFRFHLSLRDSMQSKFGFIMKTLLPLKSSDVELINLPKGLYFVYYFLRPFRLAGKYIQKIFTR
jgi:hypothetical protein